MKLLYDYWFNQFEFPDENGKPYKSSGGKMIWNEKLKREIPVKWNVESIILNSLSSVIKPGVNRFKNKIYFSTSDIKGTSILEGSIVNYNNRESRANMQPTINSVWFAKMKNSIKHLYLNRSMLPIIETSILSTGFLGLQCIDISFEYISSYISNPHFETYKDMLAHGATQEAVNNDDLARMHLIIPTDAILRSYHNFAHSYYEDIGQNICMNCKLTKIRDFLLPLLMNGQATICD